MYREDFIYHQCMDFVNILVLEIVIANKEQYN